MPRHPAGHPRPWSGRSRRPALLVLAGMAAAAGALALLGWGLYLGGFSQARLWPWGTAALRVEGPIVVISIDTLRADHLPIYGYRHVRTPALEALAAESVVFDRAYAHSPQTLPSHASLFTGRLPFQHGVRDNLGFIVRAEQTLLAERLKARGFVTGAAVSSYVLRRQVGIDQGFDFYDDRMPPASPEMSIAQVQRDGADTLAALEGWLRTVGPSRLFVFFHLYEPHTPYAPPSRYAHYAPYDGEIAYADELVGRFLATLKARRLYDPALIVLLSDHGEGLGDHGEQEHGLFLYEETIRVPLMVKLPYGRSAGRRVGRPVGLADVAPTVLDLVGAPTESGMTGRSFRALLEGREDPTPEEGVYAEALYARYHFGWSELYALTEARYRYIKAPREELYDLATDPGERRNLAGERPQVRVAMRAALDRLLAGSRLDLPSRVSEEERERLQALGYVGMQADLAAKPDEAALADPKDKIDVLERYRAAVQAAGARRFAEAIHLLRQILVDNPTMADVWQQLGNLLVRAGRYEDAVAAYKRFAALRPEEPTGFVSVAAALLKLRRLEEAEATAELAARVAPPTERRARASAYELLAKIALQRRQPDRARRYAALAQEADPSLPLPIYVRGLLLYHEGRYAEALPLFQDAARHLQPQTLQLTELHWYLGDTLARLERYEEAEAEFKREVALFPQNSRAYASLAMLYQATGRPAEAERAIAALLAAVPTPEGYALAARLWTIFGAAQRAAALRAEARQRFPGDPTLAVLDRR